MPDNRSVRIHVSGRVQGVFFRASTKARALELGIKGYVQNLQDGSVLIEAFGATSKISELIQWSYDGPTSAVVENVVIEDIPHRELSTFIIK